MTSQHLSRASPNEGFSIAHKVMDDTVKFFLANGGTEKARHEVDKLSEVVLKVYPDGWEAYQWALEQIHQAETAEQQTADSKLERMDQLIVVLNKFTQQNQQAADKNPAGKAELTGRLATPKAMKIWQRLQQEGLIDDNYQPVNLPRAKRALLADKITTLLSDENELLLGNKEWKPYEQLWGIKNLKADYQRAINQDNISDFNERLKKMFEGF